MRKIISLFLLTFISKFALTNYHKLFELGIKNYQEGKYYEAIKNFDSIIKLGYENFETYYNLGNAHYKVNQIPDAIYYYEKALQLKPNDEDTKFNLKLAQSKIYGNITVMPQPFYVRMWNSFCNIANADSWAYTSIILFILALVLLVWFLLIQNQRFKYLVFYVFVFFSIGTIISLMASHHQYKNLKDSTYAIVMTSSLGVKSSPDLKSADIAIIQAGIKVKILSSLGEWYEIRTPDGNKGWVEKKAVRRL